MTKQEISKLIFTIRAAYPSVYNKYSKTDLELLMDVWAATLEDYSYAQASAGLKAFLVGDTKGFPPTPGQVIDCITKFKQPKETNTEYLAIIRRAVSNSNYHAKEEFDKLPEICQRAVGSYRNLQEWAMLPNKEYETVISSHISRALDTTRIREKEEAKLPQSVRQQIAGVKRQQIEPDPVEAIPMKEEPQEISDDVAERIRLYREAFEG